MKFGNKIPINAEHLWKLGNLTRKYYSTEKMNVTIKLLWKCFMVICHGLITLHNGGHKKLSTLYKTHIFEHNWRIYFNKTQHGLLSIISETG
jgi:hypothetical protein